MAETTETVAVATSVETGESALEANTRAGRVEQHGTDHVPAAERHGTPRNLFAVWAGSGVSYLYFVLGGILVLLGLDAWQALAVVVAGNLFFVGVGFLAVSGPPAGVPSEVITRTFYGVRGNRVVNVVLGWLIGVLYEAINLSVGALVGFTLVRWFAPDAPDAVMAAIVIGLALLTFTISVYGHATIVRISGWVMWALLAGIAVLAWFVLANADLSYVPDGGVLEGAELWAAAAAGFTIIASAPLSWLVGADYSRYLPERSSPAKVAFWTAFGGFLPAVVIGSLGVLAGTVVDMSVPEESMAELVPAWFYPVFLLVVVIGSITNNALTAYSTGLALMASGIRWKRSITVVFDAVIAVALTLYALFVSDFLGTVSGLLEISIAVLAPALGVYAVDIVLRRNRYDGIALQDESRGGPNWHRAGWSPAGCLALGVGSVVTALCVNTTFYTGPIAAALGGADVSPFVGVLVGGGLYALLAPRTMRRAKLDAATRAGREASGSADGERVGAPA
ncbi:MAG TPA: cytosine permease [Agromyces sp.]